jgi:hypothetical protein
VPRTPVVCSTVASLRRVPVAVPGSRTSPPDSLSTPCPQVDHRVSVLVIDSPLARRCNPPCLTSHLRKWTSLRATTSMLPLRRRHVVTVALTGGRGVVGDRLKGLREVAPVDACPATSTPRSRCWAPCCCRAPRSTWRRRWCPPTTSTDRRTPTSTTPSPRCRPGENRWIRSRWPKSCAGPTSSMQSVAPGPCSPFRPAHRPPRARLATPRSSRSTPSCAASSEWQVRSPRSATGYPKTCPRRWTWPSRSCSRWPSTARPTPRAACTTCSIRRWTVSKPSMRRAMRSPARPPATSSSTS